VNPLHDFHFIRPAWLLALPVLWALALWLGRRRSRRGNWSQLVDPELMQVLRLDEADGSATRSPWPLLALVWTLIAVALSGPSWQREHAPAFRAPGAWVAILDLSPSMNANDVAPSRVERARFALDDLLNAAHEVRVGLLAFSDGAYTVAPMTEDVATIKALLPPLSPDLMPVAGDHLAPALQRAGELLKATQASNPQVIVFSDGFSDPASAFAAAAKLRSEGVTVNVVGVGTANGAPVRGADGHFSTDASGRTELTRFDADGLSRLAASGGGRYVPVDASGKLIASLPTSVHPGENAARAKDVELTHWRDGGIWLLPLLLFFAALLARRGWL